MAQENKLATSLQLGISLGQEEGKELIKSLSFSRMDVNADADTLHATAVALSTLMEHPLVSIKRNDTSLIVE